jgi:hypothetical protein
MKRLLDISLALVLALSLSIVLPPAQTTLAATTYTVDDDWQIGAPPYAEDTDGDNEFATITAALAHATSGDTIRVAIGTYNEHIQLESGVDIVSDRIEKGDTMISGSSGFPVVAANEVTDAKLDGFTVTNGSGTQSGAGIAIQSQSVNVTISNCVIIANTATYFGGGIAIYQSSANIINCTIINNNAGSTGGGIWIKNSSANITNCIITSNNAGSTGGGIYVEGTPSPTINCNNVWDNSPDDCAGCPTGVGNISDDPLFVNPSAGEYHLQSDSPCIDTGDNSAINLPEMDKDGNLRIINNTVDMGAYEYGDTEAPNQAPVADAGPDATYTLELSQPTIEVTLDGSGSTDIDGVIFAYTWSGTPDPNDVVSPTVTLSAGVHTFTLVVTDDDGATSDPDTVTITVNEAPNPNQPPAADAGPDATYTLELSQPTMEVALDGSGSTDIDGTIVAYTWSGTPDPNDVVNPTVTLSAGVYTFALVVTDNDDATSDPDTVTITVNKAMSDCEFQTFVISHMTINWAKDKDNQNNKWKWGSWFNWFKWFRKSTTKNDDTFSITGRISLPEGCTVADLEKSATVSVAITDGSGNDTVSFRELNLGKWGIIWSYRGSVRSPDEGMNITKMTIQWAPQSGEWTGWAGFNIEGVLELPEDIEMNTTPAEATVTVQIPLHLEKGSGSMLGQETVEFKLSTKLNQWYYYVWPNLHRFPYDPK